MEIKTMNFAVPTKWTGNTYPIRETLKDFGGVWSEDEKAWRLPAITGQAETVQINRVWLKNNVEVSEIAE
jgi:hypothetical protein